jgi:MMPL family
MPKLVSCLQIADFSRRAPSFDTPYAVFAAFAAGDERLLNLFGLAMESAVFLDAVVIRTLLLPAVLELFGRRAWWFRARSTTACRGSRSNRLQRPSRRPHSRRLRDDADMSRHSLIQEPAGVTDQWRG